MRTPIRASLPRLPATEPGAPAAPLRGELGALGRVLANKGDRPGDWAAGRRLQCSRRATVDVAPDNFRSLIQRGRGTGPVKPRQPSRAPARLRAGEASEGDGANSGPWH